MEQDRISRTQRMALYWAGTLAPAMELLPAAERADWLAPAVACGALWAVGGLLGRWTDGIGAVNLIRTGLGPVFGRLRLLIYIVWGEWLLALRLGLCARRLLSAGYRDGSLWFFLAVLAGVLAWIGTGRLTAFARAGQLFLAVLVVAMLVVLALSAGQAEPERILPIWWGDIPYILKGTVQAAGMLGWGVFLPFLRGAPSGRGGNGSWHWFGWCLGGGLLLTAVQAVILGNLGAELAGQLDAPFFVLAKSVGVQGAFQRVESVIAALWCCSDLVMAGVLVFALRELWNGLWTGEESDRWTGVAAVGAAFVLALWLAPRAEEWNRALSPAVSLALCAISVVFWGVAKIACGKKCGKKHMLWRKRGKKRKI